MAVIGLRCRRPLPVFIQIADVHGVDPLPKVSIVYVRASLGLAIDFPSAVRGDLFSGGNCCPWGISIKNICAGYHYQILGKMLQYAVVQPYGKVQFSHIVATVYTSGYGILYRNQMALMV